MMVTSDAWQQSYPLPVQDDVGGSTGDPLDDGGLDGVVRGLPGQHYQLEAGAPLLVQFETACCFPSLTNSLW